MVDFRVTDPRECPAARGGALRVSRAGRGILSVCHVMSSIDGRVHAFFATPVALTGWGTREMTGSYALICWPPLDEPHLSLATRPCCGLSAAATRRANPRSLSMMSRLSSSYRHLALVEALRRFA